MSTPVTDLLRLLEDRVGPQTSLGSWKWDALDLARSAQKDEQRCEFLSDELDNQREYVDELKREKRHLEEQLGAVDDLEAALRRLAIHDGVCRDCGVRPDSNTPHARTCEAARLLSWPREKRR